MRGDFRPGGAVERPGGLGRVWPDDYSPPLLDSGARSQGTGSAPDHVSRLRPALPVAGFGWL